MKYAFLPLGARRSRGLSYGVDVSYVIRRTVITPCGASNVTTPPVAAPVYGIYEVTVQFGLSPMPGGRPLRRGSSRSRSTKDHSCSEGAALFSGIQRKERRRKKRQRKKRRSSRGTLLCGIGRGAGRGQPQEERLEEEDPLRATDRPQRGRRGGGGRGGRGTTIEEDEEKKN